VGDVGARDQVGDSTTSSSKGDRVEISDAARRLASGAEAVSGQTRVKGTLSPDRIAAVTQRINEGYYDREGIREEIARRVLKDL
jgi:anti-sigma28 factor (negative regulator of flagellin synthesis)